MKIRNHRGKLYVTVDFGGDPEAARGKAKPEKPRGKKRPRNSRFAEYDRLKKLGKSKCVRCCLCGGCGR